MEKTLHGCTGCNDDKILVNKLVFDVRDPHAGDIVVFKAPPGWNDGRAPDRAQQPGGQGLSVRSPSSSASCRRTTTCWSSASSPSADRRSRAMPPATCTSAITVGPVRGANSASPTSSATAARSSRLRPSARSPCPRTGSGSWAITATPRPIRASTATPTARWAGRRATQNVDGPRLRRHRQGGLDHLAGLALAHPGHAEHVRCGRSHRRLGRSRRARRPAAASATSALSADGTPASGATDDADETDAVR